MHQEILSDEQVKMISFVSSFCPSFGLVGGTAIALQIGHRRSVDFDLFTNQPFDIATIRRAVIKHGYSIERVYRDEQDQFTCSVNGVQMTFFVYPFSLVFSQQFESGIVMPDLLTLAAMKAYALGRRAKWKDYVDLYMILSQHHSISDIAKKAKDMFGGEFNEKIFREQLVYFDDINYTEAVEFLAGHEMTDIEIQKGLIQMSTQVT